jgi:hypothetical protein
MPKEFWRKAPPGLCPSHDLHGKYDPNLLRLVAKVTQGIRVGPTPGAGRVGFDVITRIDPPPDSKSRMASETQVVCCVIL